MILNEGLGGQVEIKPYDKDGVEFSIISKDPHCIAQRKDILKLLDWIMEDVLTEQEFLKLKIWFNTFT